MNLIKKRQRQLDIYSRRCAYALCIWSLFGSFYRTCLKLRLILRRSRNRNILSLCLMHMAHMQWQIAAHIAIQSNQDYWNEADCCLCACSTCAPIHQRLLIRRLIKCTMKTHFVSCILLVILWRFFHSTYQLGVEWIETESEWKRQKGREIKKRAEKKKRMHKNTEMNDTIETIKKTKRFEFMSFANVEQRFEYVPKCIALFICLQQITLCHSFLHSFFGFCFAYLSHLFFIWCSCWVCVCETSVRSICAITILVSSGESLAVVWHSSSRSTFVFLRWFCVCIVLVERVDFFGILILQTAFVFTKMK